MFGSGWQVIARGREEEEEWVLSLELVGLYQKKKKICLRNSNTSKSDEPVSGRDGFSTLVDESLAISQSNDSAVSHFKGGNVHVICRVFVKTT